MATYPHQMPTAFQAKFTASGVMAGATRFAARAPHHLAIYETDSIESAFALAEEMDRMFQKCPEHQWPVAAQAAMGGG